LSEATKGADLLFTELVDAVRYSRDWQRSIKEQNDAKDRAAKQVDELQLLSTRISEALDSLDLDGEDSKSLSRKINEFSALAIEQAKGKIEAKLRATLDEAASESRSDELKAKKSLESYLAATPLPLIDEEVSLELSDSSYSAKAGYKCAGEIEYEFADGSPTLAVVQGQGFFLAAGTGHRGRNTAETATRLFLIDDPV